ncbi:hypothetical protein INR49_031486 [Caranx melampygus]|nr:hypothetical protein INR49_031486 [Caranx melampygus]
MDDGQLRLDVLFSYILRENINSDDSDYSGTSLCELSLADQSAGSVVTQLVRRLGQTQIFLQRKEKENIGNDLTMRFTSVHSEATDTPPLAILAEWIHSDRRKKKVNTSGVVDDTDSASNACKELAIFLTTGIVISAFGLPIVFARAEVIAWGACALVLTGNVVIFATILGFFLVFGSNDDFSWQQWLQGSWEGGKQEAQREEERAAQTER